MAIARVLAPFILLVGVLLAGPDAHAASIDEALAESSRSAADRDRDARSKPADVLRLAKPRSDMVVLDVFAGAGYYSEILSHIVGPEGRVYLHNNAAYQNLVGDAVEQRLADDRLANVVRLDAEVGELGMPDSSVDLVMMVMSYHDLYYTDEGWVMDPVSFFGEIRAMLKPGGVLIIVDHVAPPETGSSLAQTLHRIDPGFARADIESRGFRFEDASDALANPDDDYSQNVFDPAVRFHTDRFVYRFVKE